MAIFFDSSCHSSYLEWQAFGCAGISRWSHVAAVAVLGAAAYGAWWKGSGMCAVTQGSICPLAAGR